MADCFSLPNAVKLVEQLRMAAKVCDRTNNGCQFRTTLVHAADAIEALIAEKAKLKEERDAYVQLFSKTDVWKCPFCAHNRQPHRMAFADCDVAGECKNTDALPTHFELRGIKEEEDATDNASDNR